MADEAPAGTSATPGDVNWEKIYQGLPTTARDVRRDLKAILGPCPEITADDVVLVASELAANAIRHSRSGQPGGTYTVRVSHCVTGKVRYIWLEVEDQGSPSWDGTLRQKPTHGLAVIEQLATWMGTDDNGNGSRTVGARLEYRAADGVLLHKHDHAPELPECLRGIHDADEPEGSESG